MQHNTFLKMLLVTTYLLILHTHAHSHTHTHMHTRTHARTHARMHSRMHARTHTHTPLCAFNRSNIEGTNSSKMCV